jgi:hypothetical protein
MRESADEEPITWFFAPPAGVTRTVRLDAPNSGVPLTVRVTGPASEPAPGVRVALVRADDGLTAPAETDTEGAAAFSLPPGRYDVLADGELGAWGVARATVELKEGETPTLAVRVPRNPTVRVDASRLRGQEVRIGITTESQWRRLEFDAIDGKDVPVPAEGRATFRVSGDADGELLVRFFEIPSARDAPVVLDWPAPTRLVAHLVDEEGKPLSGHLSVERSIDGPWSSDDKSEPESAPAAETRLAGRVDWVAVASEPGFAATRGSVVLPAPAGGEIDLGVVRVKRLASPYLRVIAPPDFLPDENDQVRVEVRRADSHWDWVRPGEGGAVPLDLSWVRDGDVLDISVHESNVLPCDLRVSGPPPWTVRWPSASLKLHVTGKDGAAVECAVVVVDGALLEATTGPEGDLLVRGLSAGRHEVVVAESSHHGAAYTLDIVEGEARALEVRLRPVE